MSTTVTIEGRVGSDPEIKFTSSGKAVVKFSVVSSRNVKGDDGKWSESETTWWRVTAWDAFAENIADSITKGEHVLVLGRAYTEEWTDKEGNKRSSLAVNAFNVGLSLKRVKASVKRADRVKPSAPSEADPWAAGDGDVPPF